MAELVVRRHRLIERAAGQLRIGIEARERALSEKAAKGLFVRRS